MKNTFALLVTLGLFAGCQSTPETPQTPPETPPSSSNNAASSPSSSSFSQDSMYKLLVAELAGQRNRFDISLKNYNEQAQLTQDPAVAERAFRIADYLGAQEQALNNALIWSNAKPSDLEAQRATAIQLARAGRFDESLARMEMVMQQNGSTHFDFLALSAAETDPQTRQALLQSFDRLLLKQPKNAQLIFAKTLLLQQEGHTEEALALLEQIPADDSNVAPLLLQVRLLQQGDRGEEALALLDQALKTHPDDRRILLTRARLLVSLNQLDEAVSAFSALLQRYPNDEDLRLALSLLYLEQGSWQEAAYYLQELIDRQQHLEPAYFNLGRAYEEMGEPEKAIQQYQKVSTNGDFLNAQLRASDLLFSLKRPEQAREQLAQARLAEPDASPSLYLIEALGLASSGLSDDAWQLLNEALEKHPGELGLLYNRAMLAERLGNLNQSETDLREIIALQPDNRDALNALGYTLADRTTRYQEALELIERAHALDPQDPAIIDSLGWVHYRLGNLEKAAMYLQQAYQLLPDHDVGAHLGEVLWQQGQHEQARQVWRESLKNAPDSPTLRSTLLRLTGSETP